MLDDKSHPLRSLLGKLEAHHPLTASDRQAVLDLPHRLRSVEAGAYLVREGDRTEQCAVLLSGYAFRHKLTGDGARQILAIDIPGGAVDFQNIFLPEADHNVQMLTHGEVAEIPSFAIETMALGHPGVGRAILINTLVEASVFREWTLNVGRRDAHGRIAHLLCEFAVRLRGPGVEPHGPIELPLTQEQLADATGLTPVHVNRVLRLMEAEGLIERDRRVISFPNWRRLRDAGDFNARYLHIRDELAVEPA